MLIIRMDDESYTERYGATRNEFDWHVGEEFPINIPFISCIDFIQADGDELTAIVRLIGTAHNLPYLPLVWKRSRNLPDSDIRLNPVQRWYGDIAKQIAWGLS